MDKNNITAKARKLNILKGEAFQGISIDMQNKFLKQLNSVISVHSTVRETIERLDTVSLNTLFVVNDENKLVGIVTYNTEVINLFGGGERKCQALCDEKCQDRGGCFGIWWNPWGGNTKCRYECNDQFEETQDEMIDSAWF